MATYRYTNTTANGASLKLNERPVYGSSRLGSLRKEEELRTVLSFQPQDANPIQQVDLNYELTDHLGNVCAVITGRLLDGNGGSTPKQAELGSPQGYEAFGSLLPGRNYGSSSYRFGFNGKENDNDVHGATGTFQDYGMRAYDTRVGRFFSVDPIAAQYPMLTPYQFASNTPIWAIDLDGLEAWVYTETDGFGHAFIVVPTDVDVKSLTVYTYGRYNGSYTPSLGGAAPFGDGVLIKYTGRDATDFIQKRLMLGNGESTFAFEFPKADASAIREHYDKMFAAGRVPPQGSKADEEYGDKARIIDTYQLLPAGGNASSTCVTKTCEGLIVGGALDDFTPAANGERNDGGAYLDLRMQGDPKTLGAYLYLMGAQDAKDNPKDRNVITVVPNQKTD